MAVLAGLPGLIGLLGVSGLSDLAGMLDGLTVRLLGLCRHLAKCVELAPGLLPGL